MKTFSRHLGFESLKWIAGRHDNTDNTHAHIVIASAGVGLNGQHLKLSKLPSAWFLRPSKGIPSLAESFFQSGLEASIGQPKPRAGKVAFIQVDSILAGFERRREARLGRETATPTADPESVTAEVLLAEAPRPGAVEAVARLVAEGYEVNYLSGRAPEHHTVTQTWLDRQGFPTAALHTLEEEEDAGGETDERVIRVALDVLNNREALPESCVIVTSHAETRKEFRRLDPAFVAVSGLNESFDKKTGRIENFPEALTKLDQWAVWGYIQNETVKPGQKKRKVPINPRRASGAMSQKPETWASFSEAVAFIDKGRTGSVKDFKADKRVSVIPEGLTFAFREGDGITGVDIDDCRNPETGELDPLAEEIVKRFAGTYIEVSPSGKGLRIFGYGTPEKTGKKLDAQNRHIEVYDHSSPRFLTVTGKQLPQSAPDIASIQSGLDWLHEEFFKVEELPQAERPSLNRPFSEESSSYTDLEYARICLQRLGSWRVEDYHSWFQVGVALKSNFGEEGLALFDAWSAQSKDKYDPKAVRATWRGIKRLGNPGLSGLKKWVKQDGGTLPESLKNRNGGKTNGYVRSESSRTGRNGEAVAGGKSTDVLPEDQGRSGQTGSRDQGEGGQRVSDLPVLDREGRGARVGLPGGDGGDSVSAGNGGRGGDGDPGQSHGGLRGLPNSAEPQITDKTGPSIEDWPYVATRPDGEKITGTGFVHFEGFEDFTFVMIPPEGNQPGDTGWQILEASTGLIVRTQGVSVWTGSEAREREFQQAMAGAERKLATWGTEGLINRMNRLVEEYRNAWEVPLADFLASETFTSRLIRDESEILYRSDLMQPVVEQIYTGRISAETALRCQHFSEVQTRLRDGLPVSETVFQDYFLNQVGEPTAVFVFGSNEAGRHGNGAAYFARLFHGAEVGVGRGRTGNAYAIPTKDANLRPLPLAAVAENIREFLDYARTHPDLQFQVTEIGTGLAGFSPLSIIPCFQEAPENCHLPNGWRNSPVLEPAGTATPPVILPLKGIPTEMNPMDTLTNYQIPDDYAPTTGPKARFKDLIDAIDVLAQVREQKEAGQEPVVTSEMRDTLIRFPGWGALPAALFNDYGVNDGDWKRERDLLMGRLTDAEWTAAKHAILNAHYTSEMVVDAMYGMAQRLGIRDDRFEGSAKILEPAVGGRGVFFGRLPEALRAAELTGVELDKTSAEMASLLYPKATILNDSFGEAPIPFNTFDLVISNVPFSENAMFAPQLKQVARSMANKPLHDQFIVQSVLAARPGGLVMAVTSTGTMDKTSEDVREWLARNATLVGAVRLPSNTFQENANTQVVTDLLIFQKNLHGPVPDQGEFEWKSVDRVDPNNYYSPVMNNYFRKQPERVLGEIKIGRGMYRDNSLLIEPVADLKGALDAFTASLPEKIVPERKAVATRVIRYAPSSVRMGGLFVEDGQIFRKTKLGTQEVTTEFTYYTKSGERKTLPLTDEIRPRALALIDLRETVRELLNEETAGNKEKTDALRRDLNRKYDAFVARHGFLNRQVNYQILSGDPDGQVLFGIEDFKPRSTKIKGSRDMAEKKEIFFKTATQSRMPTERVNTIEEGILVSVNETGRLDVGLVSKLMNMDESSLKAELVERRLGFRTPEGTWETANEYLSGNVRIKLKEAEFAARHNPAFQVNVDALKQVQPPPIPYHEIAAPMGSIWIPDSDYSRFFRELIGREDIAHVRYSPELSKYFMQLNEYSLELEVVQEAYGTSRVRFSEVAQAALNGRAIQVTDKRADGTFVTNPEETANANDKVRELKALFEEWVFEGVIGAGGEKRSSDEVIAERRERLTAVYNEKFNALVARDYSGKGITFPGMNTQLTMKPWQRRGVERAVAGNVILGHAVGAGKTFTCIAAGMKLKQLGIVQKSLVVTPKSVIGQWTRDIAKLYPGARVISTDGHFERDERIETIARMVSEDADFLVVTFDQIKLLPLRPETRATFIQRMLDQLRDAQIAEVNDQFASDKRASSRFIKQIEKRIENLQTQLQNIHDEQRKDDGAYFEDLIGGGNIAVFYDEFHKAKNIPHPDKTADLAGKKGIPTSNSQLATDVLMINQYLAEQNEKFGKEHRIVAATGTPITNTVVEAYNLGKHFSALYEDIDNIKPFLTQFVDYRTRIERTARGYEPVERPGGFRNLPELSLLLSSFIDVQYLDDVPGIERPKAAVEVVLCPQSEELEAYQNGLVQRALELRGKRVEKGEDNILKIYHLLSSAAIDMRLVREDAEKHDFVCEDYENSKINACVKNVLEFIEQSEQAGVTRTQLIFTNTGVHPNDFGFSVVSDLTAKLVKAGIPADKIINFSSLNEVQRKIAQERLNTGDALIGIGSTETLGTGVNVQRLLGYLHHLDLSYMPSDIEQRNGRGIRQGNENKQIRIAYYLTERADEFRLGLLTTKQGFIRQFMEQIKRGTFWKREIAERNPESFSAEQMAALASGDPEMLRKFDLQEEITTLERQAKNYSKGQSAAYFRVREMEGIVRAGKKELEDLRLDIEIRDEHKAEEFVFTGYKAAGPARMTSRALAAEFILVQQEVIARNPQQKFTPGLIEIGEYKGFKIGSMLFPGGSKRVLVLGMQSRNAELSVDMEKPESLFRSADGYLSKLENRFQKQEYNVQQAESNITELINRVYEKTIDPETGEEVMTKRPFPMAQTLEDLKRELAGIDERLTAAAAEAAELMAGFERVREIKVFRSESVTGVPEKAETQTPEAIVDEAVQEAARGISKAWEMEPDTFVDAMLRQGEFALPENPTEEDMAAAELRFKAIFSGYESFAVPFHHSHNEDFFRVLHFDMVLRALNDGRFLPEAVNLAYPDPNSPLVGERIVGNAFIDAAWRMHGEFLTGKVSLQSSAKDFYRRSVLNPISARDRMRAIEARLNNTEPTTPLYQEVANDLEVARAVFAEGIRNRAHYVEMLQDREIPWFLRDLESVDGGDEKARALKNALRTFSSPTNGVDANQENVAQVEEATLERSVPAELVAQEGEGFEYQTGLFEGAVAPAPSTPTPLPESVAPIQKIARENVVASAARTAPTAQPGPTATTGEKSTRQPRGRQNEVRPSYEVVLVSPQGEVYFDSYSPIFTEGALFSRGRLREEDVQFLAGQNAFGFDVKDETPAGDFRSWAGVFNFPDGEWTIRFSGRTRAEIEENDEFPSFVKAVQEKREALTKQPEASLAETSTAEAVSPTAQDASQYPDQLEKTRVSSYLPLLPESARTLENVVTGFNPDGTVRFFAAERFPENRHPYIPTPIGKFILVNAKAFSGEEKGAVAEAALVNQPLIPGYTVAIGMVDFEKEMEGEGGLYPTRTFDWFLNRLRAGTKDQKVNVELVGVDEIYKGRIAMTIMRYGKNIGQTTSHENLNEFLSHAEHNVRRFHEVVIQNADGEENALIGFVSRQTTDVLLNVYEQHSETILNRLGIQAADVEVMYDYANLPFVSIQQGNWRIGFSGRRFGDLTADRMLPAFLENATVLPAEPVVAEEVVPATETKPEAVAVATPVKGNTAEEKRLALIEYGKAKDHDYEMLLISPSGQTAFIQWASQPKSVRPGTSKFESRMHSELLNFARGTGAEPFGGGYRAVTETLAGTDITTPTMRFRDPQGEWWTVTIGRSRDLVIWGHAHPGLETILKKLPMKEVAANFTPAETGETRTVLVGYTRTWGIRSIERLAHGRETKARINAFLGGEALFAASMGFDSNEIIETAHEDFGRIEVTATLKARAVNGTLSFFFTGRTEEEARKSPLPSFEEMAEFLAAERIAPPVLPEAEPVRFEVIATKPSRLADDPILLVGYAADVESLLPLISDQSERLYRLSLDPGAEFIKRSDEAVGLGLDGSDPWLISFNKVQGAYVTEAEAKARGEFLSVEDFVTRREEREVAPEVTTFVVAEEAADAPIVVAGPEVAEVAPTLIDQEPAQVEPESINETPIEQTVFRPAPEEEPGVEQLDPKSYVFRLVLEHFETLRNGQLDETRQGYLRQLIIQADRQMDATHEGQTVSRLEKQYYDVRSENEDRRIAAIKAVTSSYLLRVKKEFEKPTDKEVILTNVPVNGEPRIVVSLGYLPETGIPQIRDLMVDRIAELRALIRAGGEPTPRLSPDKQFLGFGVNENYFRTIVTGRTRQEAEADGKYPDLSSYLAKRELETLAKSAQATAALETRGEQLKALSRERVDMIYRLMAWELKGTSAIWTTVGVDAPTMKKRFAEVERAFTANPSDPIQRELLAAAWVEYREAVSPSTKEKPVGAFRDLMKASVIGRLSEELILVNGYGPKIARQVIFETLFDQKNPRTPEQIGERVAYLLSSLASNRGRKMDSAALLRAATRPISQRQMDTSTRDLAEAYCELWQRDIRLEDFLGQVQEVEEVQTESASEVETPVRAIPVQAAKEKPETVVAYEAIVATAEGRKEIYNDRATSMSEAEQVEFFTGLYRAQAELNRLRKETPSAFSDVSKVNLFEEGTLVEPSIGWEAMAKLVGQSLKRDNQREQSPRIDPVDEAMKIITDFQADLPDSERVLIRMVLEAQQKEPMTPGQKQFLERVNLSAPNMTRLETSLHILNASQGAQREKDLAAFVTQVRKAATVVKEGIPPGYTVAVERILAPGLAEARRHAALINRMEKVAVNDLGKPRFTLDQKRVLGLLIEDHRTSYLEREGVADALRDFIGRPAVQEAFRKAGIKVEADTNRLEVRMMILKAGAAREQQIFKPYIEMNDYRLLDPRVRSGHRLDNQKKGEPVGSVLLTEVPNEKDDREVTYRIALVPTGRLFDPERESQTEVGRAFQGLLGQDPSKVEIREFLEARGYAGIRSQNRIVLIQNRDMTVLQETTNQAEASRLVTGIKQNASQARRSLTGTALLARIEDTLLSDAHAEWVRDGKPVVAVDQNQNPVSDRGIARLIDIAAQGAALEDLRRGNVGLEGYIARRQAARVAETRNYAEVVASLEEYRERVGAARETEIQERREAHRVLLTGGVLGQSEIDNPLFDPVRFERVLVKATQNPSAIAQFGDWLADPERESKGISESLAEKTSHRLIAAYHLANAEEIAAARKVEDWSKDRMNHAITISDEMADRYAKLSGMPARKEWTLEEITVEMVHAVRSADAGEAQAQACLAKYEALNEIKQAWSNETTNLRDRRSEHLVQVRERKETLAAILDGEQERALDRNPESKDWREVTVAFNREEMEQLAGYLRHSGYDERVLQMFEGQVGQNLTEWRTLSERMVHRYGTVARTAGIDLPNDPDLIAYLAAEQAKPTTPGQLAFLKTRGVKPTEIPSNKLDASLRIDQELGWPGETITQTVREKNHQTPGALQNSPLMTIAAARAELFKIKVEYRALQSHQAFLDRPVLVRDLAPYAFQNNLFEQTLAIAELPGVAETEKAVMISNAAAETIEAVEMCAEKGEHVTQLLETTRLIHTAAQEAAGGETEGFTRYAVEMANRGIRQAKDIAKGIDLVPQPVVVDDELLAVSPATARLMRLPEGEMARLTSEYATEINWRTEHIENVARRLSTTVEIIRETIPHIDEVFALSPEDVNHAQAKALGIDSEDIRARLLERIAFTRLDPAGLEALPVDLVLSRQIGRQDLAGALADQAAITAPTPVMPAKQIVEVVNNNQRSAEIEDHQAYGHQM